MPRSAHDDSFTRYDAAIVAAARTTFLRDPDAPMAEVAAAAGVGISALYRRYSGRDGLMRRLCQDGLQTYLDVAADAGRLADPWEAFVHLATELVRADVHSLTVRLAGTFTSTVELSALATLAGRAGAAIVRRATRAGVLRPGLGPNDLVMLLEQLAAIRVEDDARTSALRERYLFLHLASWRREPVPVTAPPGRPPTNAEAVQRWRRAGSAERSAGRR